mmetsp:Transcript_65495/g.165018  ORF Transcript_65495/g.165018 Transcript_65495/m.165018 type:complete len:86 (+) Transcript_65495:941-1198(+)
MDMPSSHACCMSWMALDVNGSYLCWKQIPSSKRSSDTDQTKPPAVGACAPRRNTLITKRLLMSSALEVVSHRLQDGRWNSKRYDL